jgi:uncharacterized protein (TIGR03435 family)
MTLRVLRGAAFFLCAAGLAILAQVSGPLPPMDPNANPSFDVATVKPNDSGKPSMQGLTIIGRRFKTVNASPDDLIQVAYEVQAKQIVNGPDWMSKKRYDIIAVTDRDGVPNATQVRNMMQKLLADRFKLEFHHDQRVLPAYALTVGKIGPKLTPTEKNGQLPNFHYEPIDAGVTLFATNATMTDFSGYLQLVVLDRPVVNRTGTTGRFDFQCTFTPDDSQFNGHSPLPAGAGSSPSLYEALQQQLGLRLSAERASIDVIVVDHIEPPSEN